MRVLAPWNIHPLDILNGRTTVETFTPDVPAFFLKEDIEDYFRVSYVPKGTKTRQCKTVIGSRDEFAKLIFAPFDNL